MNLHHVTMVRRTLDEAIFWIFFHQLQLVGEGSGTFFDGLINWPVPCGIHMGMADKLGNRSETGIFILIKLSQFLLRLFDCS